MLPITIDVNKIVDNSLKRVCFSCINAILWTLIFTISFFKCNIIILLFYYFTTYEFEIFFNLVIHASKISNSFSQ